MVDQGISRLYWVCKCRNGFFSRLSPAIHILAGEKGCSQVINPTQFFVEFASRHNSRMASGVVSTGLKPTWTGTCEDAPRAVAISRECSATVSNVFGPYKCWLPVTNQTSYPFRSIILTSPFMILLFVH